MFGASGSGTTTLAAELARAVELTHIDADDHYWKPSDPPFSEKRNIADRLKSMHAAMDSDSWIISGSCHSWANEIIKDADLLVFVHVPKQVRLQRLAKREAERFGGRILAGGDMFEIHNAFLAWAGEYDSPLFEGRSRAGHEKWLEHQSKPVCRLDGSHPISDLVRHVRARMV